MTGRRLRLLARVFGAAALVAGCARVPARPSATAGGDGLAGWQALSEGRRADAAALFDRAVGAARAKGAAPDPNRVVRARER